MLNGIALSVRAHRAESLNFSPNCQTTSAFSGRQFGHVVRISIRLRSGHHLRVGFDGHSLRLSKLDGLAQFSLVPQTTLIRRRCLIHLENSLIRQRILYNAAIVVAGKAKSLVKNTKRLSRSASW